MIFKRILNKIKAAADPPRAAALARGARTAPEPSPRQDEAAKRDALAQVAADLDLLLASEPSPDAAARLRNALCDAAMRLDPTQHLLDRLAQVDDAELMAHLALQAHHPDVRRISIQRVEAAAVLVECALQDRLAVNRVLAAERLQDKAALEELLRRIGKRDKSVYRLARERLREIADQEERPRRVLTQCEDICGKLGRLGRLASWTQDRALLEHLDRQWAEISAEAPADWVGRFQAERRRFLDAYAAHLQETAAQLAEQESRNRARQDAEALLDELEHLSETTPPEALAAAQARILAAWESIPAQERAPLESRYAALRRSASDARRAHADHLEQSEQIRGLVAHTERMLAESKPLDQKQAQSLLEQARGLICAQPDSPEAAALEALSERLESRLGHQRKHAEQKLARIAERILELEQHLADGELKKAEPLFQSIQAGLELVRASGLRHAEEAKLSGRLRALAPRLRELNNWRRWGTDQHREELCELMEALVTKEAPLEALAERLRTLQADWKRLDKAGSAASNKLWERFHAASEAVYARCRPFMDAQTEARQANRAARERVCEQLEDFLSKVDWDRVDWKKTLHAERAMRQTWAEIGPTDGRYHKALERRFHQSLRQLDHRLDAERKRNQALKHDLVARARALAELPDLDAAIEQTKALQRQWHTTVAARQKDENALWQSFRAACDAVFARRSQARQAQSHELTEHLAQREAICKEAQEIAAHEQDPKRLAAAQQALLDRWRSHEHLPVPRQSASALERSWRAAYAELGRQRRASEASRHQAAFDLLARQAQLCEDLELSLTDATASPRAVEDVRAAWSQLPTQDDTGLQQAIQGRLDRALAAVDDPDRLTQLKTQLPVKADKRRQLCLRFEIAAGIDSPPELAQQRLELQVARLAERLSEGEEDRIQDATRLLREWYLCGPAPQDAALRSRFERARAALSAPSRVKLEAQEDDL